MEAASGTQCDLIMYGLVSEEHKLMHAHVVSGRLLVVESDIPDSKMLLFSRVICTLKLPYTRPSRGVWGQRP